MAWLQDTAASKEDMSLRAAALSQHLMEALTSINVFSSMEIAVGETASKRA